MARNESVLRSLLNDAKVQYEWDEDRFWVSFDPSVNSAEVFHKARDLSVFMLYGRYGPETFTADEAERMLTMGCVQKSGAMHNAE